MEKPATSEDGRATSPSSDVTRIWDRFSHRFDKVSNYVFAHGDTTTKFHGGKKDPRFVSFSHDTGDVVNAFTLSPCTDACQHDDEELEDRYRVVIRPDGLVEGFHPKTNKKSQAVEVFALDSEPPSASQRTAWPPPSQVCEECSEYDFSVLYPGIITSNKDLDEQEEVSIAFAAIEKPDSSDQAFHKTYPELQESAKTCACCAVLLSALPQSNNFISDEVRPIVLRSDVKDKGEFDRSLWYIDVGFPSVDARHPGRQVTRYGRLDIIAAPASFLIELNAKPIDAIVSIVTMIPSLDEEAATWPFAVVGRPVLAADSSDQACQWIQDCQKNHAVCQIESTEHPLPTRIIHVPSDESADPWLEDSNGRAAEYVALSYRWGSAQLSKTLLSNLSEYKRGIPFDILSKTIQHGIIMTKKLGYKYLWVDCLCIIQDSPEDWKREASQMAAIYRNATLTLSASACESAESGLFYPNPDNYQVRLHARSLEGIPVASFSIVVRSSSTFESDVRHGTLSKRGWCLQERLLSRRILHFGSSQTHWECLEGVWSASHGRKLSGIDVDLRRDFQTKLQASIPRKGRASLLLPGAPITVKTASRRSEDTPSKPSTRGEPLPPLRQLYGHEPHGTWYRMLLDYSTRSLTVSTDKLAALSGLATTFATQTGDVYLSGLWLNGLPEGLLWSSVGLGRGQYGSKSRSKNPPSRRAPTWSWASLDGPVLYAAGKYAFVDAVVYAYSMPGTSRTESCCESKHSDMLGLNPFQRLVLKGMVEPLEMLSGFKAEQRQFLLDNKDSRGAFYVPHAFWDDPDYEPSDLEGVMALFIAQVGCGNRDCNHKADCGTGFAHCLLVKANESGRKLTFRRVGVAQCYSGDFIGATRIFITLV